jgi:hypothetical protein
VVPAAIEVVAPTVVVVASAADVVAPAADVVPAAHVVSPAADVVAPASDVTSDPPLPSPPPPSLFPKATPTTTLAHLDGEKIVVNNTGRMRSLPSYNSYGEFSDVNDIKCVPLYAIKVTKDTLLSVAFADVIIIDPCKSFFSDSDDSHADFASAEQSFSSTTSTGTADLVTAFSSVANLASLAYDDNNDLLASVEVADVGADNLDSILDAMSSLKLKSCSSDAASDEIPVPSREEDEDDKEKTPVASFVRETSVRTPIAFLNEDGDVSMADADVFLPEEETTVQDVLEKESEVSSIMELNKSLVSDQAHVGINSVQPDIGPNSIPPLASPSKSMMLSLVNKDIVQDSNSNPAIKDSSSSIKIEKHAPTPIKQPAASNLDFDDQPLAKSSKAPSTFDLDFGPDSVLPPPPQSSSSSSSFPANRECQDADDYLTEEETAVKDVLEPESEASSVMELNKSLVSDQAHDIPPLASPSKTMMLSPANEEIVRDSNSNTAIENSSSVMIEKPAFPPTNQPAAFNLDFDDQPITKSSKNPYAFTMDFGPDSVPPSSQLSSSSSAFPANSICQEADVSPPVEETAVQDVLESDLEVSSVMELNKSLVSNQAHVGIDSVQLDVGPDSIPPLPLSSKSMMLSPANKDCVQDSNLTTAIGDSTSTIEKPAPTPTKQPAAFNLDFDEQPIAKSSKALPVFDLDFGPDSVPPQSSSSSSSFPANPKCQDQQQGDDDDDLPGEGELPDLVRVVNAQSGNGKDTTPDFEEEERKMIEEDKTPKMKNMLLVIFIQ